MTPTYKDFKRYCLDHDLTITQGCRELGTSRDFLNKVLTGLKPCPPALSDKLSEVLGLDPVLVGLGFGHYPEAWTLALKENPAKIAGIIKWTLDNWSKEAKSS